MYILDIETTHDKKLLKTFVKNIKPSKTLKNEEKIAADIAKKTDRARAVMQLDHDYADIVCIGVKPLREKARLYTLEQFSIWLNVPKEEPGIGYVGHNYNKIPITFNGAEFDIPILLKSAIKQEIEDFPFASFMSKMGRWPKGHIDMMQNLSLAWGKNKSLDHYLQIYLGIEKTPIDFETATVKEIKKHCLEDLKNTQALFEKVRPLIPNL